MFSPLLSKPAYCNKLVTNQLLKLSIIGSSEYWDERTLRSMGRWDLLAWVRTSATLGDIDGIKLRRSFSRKVISRPSRTKDKENFYPRNERPTKARVVSNQVGSRNCWLIHQRLLRKRFLWWIQSLWGEAWLGWLRSNNYPANVSCTRDGLFIFGGWRKCWRLTPGL